MGSTHICPQRARTPPAVHCGKTRTNTRRDFNQHLPAHTLPPLARALSVVSAPGRVGLPPCLPVMPLRLAFLPAAQRPCHARAACCTSSPALRCPSLTAFLHAGRADHARQTPLRCHCHRGHDLPLLTPPPTAVLATRRLHRGGRTARMNIWRRNTRTGCQQLHPPAMNAIVVRAFWDGVLDIRFARTGAHTRTRTNMGGVPRRSGRYLPNRRAACCAPVSFRSVWATEPPNGHADARHRT